MNNNINKMCACHISAIAQIEKECFSAPWSENALREELSNDKAIFFVYEIGNEVAGYIGCHTILDEGYIANVAVSKKFRKQGIGNALVAYLVEKSIETKLAFLTLEVRKSNQNAINLYQKHLFVSVGERKNYYTNPTENAILMTRTFT